MSVCIGEICNYKPITDIPDRLGVGIENVILVCYSQWDIVALQQQKVIDGEVKYADSKHKAKTEQCEQEIIHINSLSNMCFRF